MRVAIVRLTSLGDVVHTLPVAAALRRHRRDATVAWIVEAHEQVLLAGNPSVDAIVVAPLRRWRGLFRRGRFAQAASELRSFARQLRDLRVDVVIDVQGWWHKTSPIVALTRAPFRIGFDRRFARDFLSPLFTTAHVVPPAEAVHVVDQNLALLTPLGIKSPVAEFPLPSWPDAEDRVAAWMRAHALRRGAFVVLLPSTRGPRKLWPAARYAAVARRLHESVRMPIVIAGGPFDARVLAQVTAGFADVLVYAPEPVTDLAVFLASAAIVIGNDTGPLHLAAAANIPSLGLFGPTSGARNGPYGPAGRFIQSPTSDMADIGVDDVVTHARDMLRRR
jgi:heptosyltransferase-1